VHAHNIYAQLSFSILEAARERGVRVVMTAHDYKLVCPNYQMLDHGKLCEKCLGHRYHHCLTSSCHKDDRLYSAINTVEAYFNHWTGKERLLAQVLCPSAFLMGKLASGIPVEKLRVVRNPVEVKEGRGSDEGYFLYAGRLSSEKGVRTLVECFRELDLPLVVAGTGPLEGELRAEAEGSRTRLTGHVTGVALDALYRGAKACLVPSEWYENAPLSVLEGMAHGKPVLAAAIGGVPELVREGETGRLFKAFDREDLKRVVRGASEAPAGDLRDLGQRAREWVGRELTPRRHYEELMEAYRG
jgi:glycosyltransferase involved in cell wall biosynthesis